MCTVKWCVLLFCYVLKNNIQFTRAIWFDDDIGPILLCLLSYSNICLPKILENYVFMFSPSSPLWSINDQSLPHTFRLISNCQSKSYAYCQCSQLSIKYDTFASGLLGNVSSLTLILFTINLMLDQIFERICINTGLKYLNALNYFEQILICNI